MNSPIGCYSNALLQKRLILLLSASHSQQNRSFDLPISSLAGIQFAKKRSDTSSMLVTLFRIDKNERYHYFMLHDRQASLFEPFALTTSYVINHGKARERLFTFKTRQDMDSKIRAVFKTKLKAGYRYLYGFDRSESHLVSELAALDRFAKYG